MRMWKRAFTNLFLKDPQCAMEYGLGKTGLLTRGQVPLFDI